MSHDEQFPHLQDALDPVLMAPLLASAFSVDGPLRCHIGEKRHKPGKSCVITYRVTGNRDPGEIAVARLCSPGKAHAEFVKELRRRPELLTGRDLSFIASPAMLLWRFPSDRKLIHLPRLLDRAWLNAHLPAKLAILGMAPDDRIISIEQRVMHYIPERSCMVRFEVVVRSNSGDVKSICLYGKTYAGDDGAATYAAMCALDGQFRHGARPLAYDTDLRTLWQSHVPGQPLNWTHLESPKGDIIAEGMGRCTAELHGCADLPIAARQSQEDVDQALLETVAMARSSRPDLLPGLNRLVQTLLAHRLAADWEHIPDSVLHHDLKLNNFLVEGTSLGLIDMDCLCLGDPLADLGSLIANLYLHGLREGLSAEVVHPHVRTLACSYRRSAIHAVPWARLRWHTSAALIHEVVRRSLRQLDEKRLALVHAFLDVCAHYAAQIDKPGSEFDDFV